MVKTAADVAEKWKTRYCMFAGLTEAEAKAVGKGELAAKCGMRVAEAYLPWV